MTQDISSRGGVVDISVRSYLTAGVAAQSATAIVMAPLQVRPPDIQVRADRQVVVVDDIDLAVLPIPLGLESSGAVGQGLTFLYAATITGVTGFAALVNQALLLALAGQSAAAQALVESLAPLVLPGSENLFSSFATLVLGGCVQQSGVRVGPDQRYRRVVAE